MIAFLLYVAALILFVIAALGRGPAWLLAAGLACLAGAGVVERWPG
jgi:hypothetical protein